MKHQVTIKDIAKQLGISPSTVSRALKDHPDISQKTKEAVLKLANELKYRPNPTALQLRKQENKTIGVIIPQIVHYFFSSVISGIEDFAYENGYAVLLAQSNENYERENRNVELMLSSGVAGVLISRSKETTDFSHFETLLSYNVPVIFFDRICPGLKTDKVIINDELAAYIATEHLVKTGCRRIVHFRGPENLEISRKRQTGYLEAFFQYNLPVDESLIITCDTFEQAKIQTQKLIDKKVNFDAIFAVNDETAAGALLTLMKNNIKIPQEVSVIGYSNDLISQVISPKLSTMEQQGYKMGYTATKLLIERISSDKELRPRTEVISTKLVLRETTKKL